MQLTNEEEAVPRRPIDSLTPAEFRRLYLVPNRPVVLTGATVGWRAASDWVTADGEPDLPALARLFGEDVVPVADCSRNGRLGGRAAAACRDMRVAEYAAWWQGSGRASGECLYLKDWTFAAKHPEYRAYHTPAPLADDWLNEHWAARRGEAEEVGDHRFVYLGPAGSTTPLHADVLFSYSWSANLCGVKHWQPCASMDRSVRARGRITSRHSLHRLLVPASQRALVSDSASDPLHGGLRALSAAGGAPLEVTQRAGENDSRAGVESQSSHCAQPQRGRARIGELLFVPSGWYHEVTNLTPVLSVNHNWLNGANATWALRRCSAYLAAIRAGLNPEDAADATLCMQLLRRRAGVDLRELVALAEGAADRRSRCREEHAGEAATKEAEGEEEEWRRESLRVARSLIDGVRSLAAETFGEEAWEELDMGASSARG